MTGSTSYRTSMRTIDQRSAVAVIAGLTILAMSAIGYAGYRAQTQPLPGQWRVWFADVTGQGMPFTVANDSPSTVFHWAVTVGKKQAAAGDVTVAPGVQVTVDPALAADVLRGTVTVTVTDADGAHRDVFKNF